MSNSSEPVVYQMNHPTAQADGVSNLPTTRFIKKEKVYPVCTNGGGVCPPEDCGGPWGFMEFRILVFLKPGEVKSIDTWVFKSC